MEFWGVEVKSGEPLKVKPGDGLVVHLSQACLGEVKKDKGSESIRLYVSIDKQKVVLGILSAEKFPQISFDLVFKKDFELSHNWKNGSVYFCGYKAPFSVDSSGSSDSDSEPDSGSGEDLPLNVANNGKPESQAKQAKPAAEMANIKWPDPAKSKKQVKIVEPKRDADESLSDELDEDESDYDSSEDEVMVNGEDSSEEDEEENNYETNESSEDEEMPKKVELSKKRTVVSATKVSGSDKKAKLVTPQETVGADGKKGGGHTATPYPSKQAGKRVANSDQEKQQTQKSGGTYPCKSCTRSFKSEDALQNHTKAKHRSAE